MDQRHWNRLAILLQAAAYVAAAFWAADQQPWLVPRFVDGLVQQLGRLMK